MEKSPYSLQVDSSGEEGEGIDGFGRDDRGPLHVLEPFDSQFATSSCAWWGGTA